MPSHSTLGPSGPRLRVGSVSTHHAHAGGDNNLLRGGGGGDADEQRSQLVSLHEALCHSVEHVVGQLYHGPIGGGSSSSPSPHNVAGGTTTDVVFNLAKALNATNNTSTIATNNGVNNSGAVSATAGIESALKGIVDPAVLLFDQYSVRLETWVGAHFNAAIESTDVDTNNNNALSSPGAISTSANNSSFFGTTTGGGDGGVPPSPIQAFTNNISPSPSPQQQNNNSIIANTSLPHLHHAANNASWTMSAPPSGDGNNTTMCQQQRESSMMLGGSGAEKKIPQLTDVGSTLEIMLKLEGAPPTSSFTKRPSNAIPSSQFEAGVHQQLGKLPPHLAGTASAIFQADESTSATSSANSHSRPNSRIQGGNVSPNRRPTTSATTLSHPADAAHRLSTPGNNNDTSSVASKGVLGYSTTTNAASLIRHPGVPARRPAVLLVAAFDVTSLLLQHPADSKVAVELRLACQVRHVCDSINAIQSRGAHVVLGIAPYSDTPNREPTPSSSSGATHPEVFSKVSELVKQALLLPWTSGRSHQHQHHHLPHQPVDISSPLPPTIEATCPSISTFASIEELTGQSIPTLLDLNVFGIHGGDKAAAILSDTSTTPSSSSSTRLDSSMDTTAASILHAAALASESAKAARRMAMLRNKKAISGLINAGAVDVSSILGDRRTSNGTNTTTIGSNNVSFSAATATAAAAAAGGANASTTTPVHQQNSLTTITSRGTRPRLCIVNLGTICTTILQTVQSIHQDCFGDDEDDHQEVADDDEGGGVGGSITSSSFGVGGGSATNSTKLANIQKIAVSRVFGSLLDSVSLLVCAVLEDSFGCLWENSRRWLVPSSMHTSQTLATPSSSLSSTFPSYLSPLQDLLLALERSTRSRVLSLLSTPISPSLPTHHPTRKIFESLTSPFISTPASSSSASIGGDAFPAPHRSHVLSSSQSYKLSGPSSTSTSSSSQHLPFLFYSSPASTQESVRALLCSLVNGCTTDLLQSSSTSPPQHHHTATTAGGSTDTTTVANTPEMPRRRRVKMLILGDGDGDQCLTLSEWVLHMRRVSEIVCNTFGPAGRRRKSNTNNTGTTTSDSTPPHVHHAPPANKNRSSSPESRSTPYYPTSLELLVASVEEVVESAFSDFIQIEQELREQTEAANKAAHEALGDIQKVEEIQGDSSSSSSSDNNDLLSISGDGMDDDGGDLLSPRSRAAQLGLTKDALVRHFLGMLVRSMSEEIFIGGKAAPVLRILADQREAMEELGFGAGDGGGSLAGSGSTRRPQQQSTTSTTTTTTQPPPVLPAFVPASLIRACEMLLDVVSSVGAVNDEEEVEADDATVATEEGGKQLGSSIALPNGSGGGTMSSSVNTRRTTSTSTAATKAAAVEDSDASLEALFRSSVLGQHASGGSASPSAPQSSLSTKSKGGTLNNQPTCQSIFTNCAPGSISAVSISRPRNRVTSVSINMGGGGGRGGGGLAAFDDEGSSGSEGGDQVSMASSMFASSFMSNSTAGANRTGVDIDPPFAFLKKKPLASASSADRWALLPPPTSATTGNRYGSSNATNSYNNHTSSSGAQLLEDHLRRAFASQPVALLLPADIIVSRVTTSRKVRSDTFGLTDVSRLAVPSRRRGRDDETDDAPSGAGNGGVVCDAPSTAVLTFKDRVKLLLMYDYDFAASKQGDPSTNRHIKTEQHTVYGSLSNAHRRRYTDIGPLSVGALNKRFVNAAAVSNTITRQSSSGAPSSTRVATPASTSVIWVGNIGSSLIQMRSQLDDGAVMPFAIRKLIADGEACFGDDAVRRGIQRAATSRTPSHIGSSSASMGGGATTAKTPSPSHEGGVGGGASSSAGTGGGVLVPGPPKPLVPLPSSLVEGLLSSSSIPEQALQQLLMGDSTTTSLLNICASGVGITSAAAPAHHSTNTSINTTTTNNNNTTASFVKQPWLETSKHGAAATDNKSRNMSTISENGLTVAPENAGGSGADDSVDLYQQSVEFYRLLRTSSTLCLLNAIGGSGVTKGEANFTAVSSGQIQAWSGLLPSSTSSSSSSSTNPRRPHSVPMQVIPVQLFFKNLAQPFVTPRYGTYGGGDGKEDSSGVLSFHSSQVPLDLNGTSPPPSSLSQNRPNNNRGGGGNHTTVDKVSIAASHVEIVMALSNLLL